MSDSFENMPFPLCHRAKCDWLEILQRTLIKLNFEAFQYNATAHRVLQVT